MLRPALIAVELKILDLDIATTAGRDQSNALSINGFTDTLKDLKIITGDDLSSVALENEITCSGVLKTSTQLNDTVFRENDLIQIEATSVGSLKSCLELSLVRNEDFCYERGNVSNDFSMKSIKAQKKKG